MDHGQDVGTSRLAYARSKSNANLLFEWSLAFVEGRNRELFFGVLRVVSAVSA